MDLNKAAELFYQIESTRSTTLKSEFLNAAVRYAGLRVQWYLADNEGRIEIDPERTISHNAFIDACNILSRNMLKNGEDAEWRKQLGDNRKDIGDFASFIFLIICLRAR